MLHIDACLFIQVGRRINIGTERDAAGCGIIPAEDLLRIGHMGG